MDSDQNGIQPSSISNQSRTFIAELDSVDPMTLNDEFKRHKVKRTFQQISQLCIYFAIGVVVYYDLLMIWPHLGAMFWAVAVSVVLARPQRALLHLREHLDRRLASSKTWIVAVIGVVYVGVVLAAATATSPLTMVLWSVAFGLFLFVICGEPRLVVAVCLLGAIIAGLALPMVVIVKISTDEVNEMVIQIHDFVANSADLWRLVDDFGSSRLFRYFGVRLPQWDAEAFKAQAMSMASYAAAHLASMLNLSIVLVNRTSSAVVSLITFLTFLFYLLTDDPLRFYDGLSPFSESDTRHILDSVRKSVMRTFVCSAALGVIHALLTYVTFVVCDLPFRLIVSAISALLSIMPFVGTWVVWVPIAVAFAAQGQYVKAAVVTILQLFGDLYLDGVVRSYIPGNSYFVGLSVAMGGYVFGPEGILAGPLLAGISMTLLDIFKEYSADPAMESAESVISKAPPTEPAVFVPTQTPETREKRKLP